MLETENMVVPASSGNIDGKTTGKRKPARRLIAAAVAGVLLLVAAVSWFMLYVTTLNPGD